MKQTSQTHGKKWIKYNLCKSAELYRPGQPNWEHNVKILGSICQSNLTWNQFWSFWCPKNCHFDHLSNSEFWIFGNFWHIQVSNSKNQDSKPTELLKRQILTFWNQQKLISRKIRVHGKLLNFCTVTSEKILQIDI